MSAVNNHITLSTALQKSAAVELLLCHGQRTMQMEQNASISSIFGSPSND